MLFRQAQKIKNHPFRPEVVVGIARGGIVPARFLADFLETLQFGILQIELYLDIGIAKTEPTLKHELTCKVSGKTVLLVDDIADSGKTLQFAIIHLTQLGAASVKTATLYHKPHSVFTPDFYEKQTSNWVVFPWDLQETLRKIIQKQKGKRQVNREIANLVNAGLPKTLADKLLKDML